MGAVLHNFFLSQTEYFRFRDIVAKLSRDELYKKDAAWLRNMLGKDIKIPQRTESIPEEGVSL